MKKYVKTTVLFFCFFYLTLYLPVFTSLYIPHWYTANCHFHGRCERVGLQKSHQGIHELTSYYRHTSDNLPSSFWTAKEKLHLEEVRHMTDSLFYTALIALVLFFICFDIHVLRCFALINLLSILMLLFILPFFPYFWRHIFHPLLFTNMNWLNTPNDFSYYILPRAFFRNTLIFMIVSSSLINLAVFLTTGCLFKKNTLP